MWTTLEIESTKTNTSFSIKEDGSPITHRRFFELLESTQSFRQFYNSVLAQSDYEAFLWENKPVTQHNLHEQYECNLINSNYLAGKSPDTDTFSQYFRSDKNVVTFPNLGKDAQLIAPCPQKNPSNYPHIGTFVRRCDEEQIDDFWRVTAEQMLLAIEEEPRWLSTSGLGVFWLHTRIDSRPKYYQTKAYKRI